MFYYIVLISNDKNMNKKIFNNVQENIIQS